MVKEIIIDCNGSNVYVIRNWLQKEEANELCKKLKQNINWEVKNLKIFGMEVQEPRRTYVMGEKGIKHIYSGIEREMNEWQKSVETIKNKVNEEFSASINACLLNEYATGKEYIGYHSDKEVKEPRNLVVSISLGGTRRFIFKSKTTKDKKELLLHNGDLVVMEGNTQKQWIHSIPKTLKKCKKCDELAIYGTKEIKYCEKHKEVNDLNLIYRISLTFRELHF